MEIISYGRMDKKLLLILFIIVARTIHIIIEKYTPDDSSQETLCYLQEDIGIIFVGVITKLFFKQNSKRKSKIKRSFKHLIILFFLILVSYSFEYIYLYINPKLGYAIIHTTNGIEFILMSIVTSFLLNYSYYKHHVVTMLIYLSLGIITDLILGNFSKTNYKNAYIYIIYSISEVIFYCYLKYMMDKLYDHYSEVSLYYGAFGLIIK